MRWMTLVTLMNLTAAAHAGPRGLALTEPSPTEEMHAEDAFVVDDVHEAMSTSWELDTVWRRETLCLPDLTNFGRTCDDTEVWTEECPSTVTLILDGPGSYPTSTTCELDCGDSKPEDGYCDCEPIDDTCVDN